MAHHSHNAHKIRSPMHRHTKPVPRSTFVLGKIILESLYI